MDWTTIIGTALFAAVIVGICLSNLARPKTKVCRHCQSVIATKATTCPNCRRTQPSTLGVYVPGAFRFGLIIFVIVFIIMTIAGLFS